MSRENVLVSTEWAEENLNKAQIRFVEVDVDTKAYDQEGHIPGAIGWNWQKQLCDTLTRDVVPKNELEALLSQSGIEKDTTIILYGDNNNWFACWALWQLEMFGHENVKIMDGGRKKWLAEGRPLSTDKTEIAASSYSAPEIDSTARALLAHVMEASPKGEEWALVDVRSPDEFSGKVLCPPGLPETCQRGGHIPNAKNIPWGKNCNEDGTFKSNDDLQGLYEPLGVTADKNVIAYCRIGERSSLSWFVLKHLLDFPNVQNYDGSWTEWGNLVSAPIERGA